MIVIGPVQCSGTENAGAAAFAREPGLVKSLVGI